MYAFGIFSFCVYFLYASVQQNLIISKHYLHFYLLQDIVLRLQVIFVQWMHNNNEKCWENRYVYYMLCSVLYYIVHTNNSFTIFLLYIFFFSLLLACGNDGVFLFTYYCKWGGHTYHFYMALLSMFSAGAHFVWTWVPLLLASYFDVFILLASYFDGCKFRK